jgi:hypothetical protein
MNELMTGDEAYEAAIRRVVDAAPPISAAQRDKLATLLDDGWDAPLTREQWGAAAWMFKS